MIPEHSVLLPAGPQAAHIAQLWWLMLGACALVFVAMMGALAWSLWRAPRANADTPPTYPSAASETTTKRSVAIAVVISASLLLGLLVANMLTDRALAHLPREGAVNVRMAAHQWWWEITYDDAQPTRIFSTANELHIPVGRPVIVTLTSSDVIHSLWVPSLAGKKDLIPGRTSTIEFRADQPGEYVGPCAEFCGLQHAHMTLAVIAMPAAEFDAWAQAQRKPAPDPSDPRARRGRELFMTGSCMMCHAIQGTTALARMAPDLTHVATRERLAAGLVPNTPQNLARWIRDPQRLKPGADMPAHPLPDDELDALVAYLETLK